MMITQSRSESRCLGAAEVGKAMMENPHCVQEPSLMATGARQVEQYSVRI
jgi:hypothetical protein